MFKNRLDELIVGRKFTVFSLFYFVFDGTVFKYKPPGAYIRRGHLTKGFLHYGFEGLIHCTWRGLFLEVYKISLIELAADKSKLE